MFLASPPRAYYKSRQEVLFVFPQPLPNSDEYRVTFKSEWRPGATSRAEAQKVDSKTLLLNLPDHGQQGKVRVTVHVTGSRPVQGEYEFVSLGRSLLDQFPRPVPLSQLLGLMLLLPSEEIRQDAELFEAELEQCLQSPLPSLKLAGILEDLPVTTSDAQSNLLHLAAEFSLTKTADYILRNEKLFPTAKKELHAANEARMCPIDIAVLQDDQEMVELLKSSGAQESDQPAQPFRQKAATHSEGTVGKFSNTFSVLKDKAKGAKRLAQGFRTRSTADDKGEDVISAQGGSDDESIPSDDRSRSLPRILSSGEEVAKVTRPMTPDKKRKESKKVEEGSDSPKPKKLGGWRKLPGIKPKKVDKARRPSTGEATTPTDGGEQVLSAEELQTHLSKVIHYARVKQANVPESAYDNQLKLQVGDIVAVTHKSSTGLWTGVINNKKLGKFSFVYVEAISKEEADAALGTCGGVNRPPMPVPSNSANRLSQAHLQARALPQEPSANPVENTEVDNQETYEAVDPDEFEGVYDEPEGIDRTQSNGIEADLESLDNYEGMDDLQLDGEGEEEMGRYDVLYQAEVIRDYVPRNYPNEQDYLELKRGAIVNVLRDVEDENCAFVEYLGKIGRVWASYIKKRLEILPFHHQKPIYLQGSSSAHIESIVPGDSLLIYVDNQDDSLRILSVRKGSSEPALSPAPDVQDLPPPPPSLDDEEEQEEYECMEQVSGGSAAVPARKAYQDHATKGFPRPDERKPSPVSGPAGLGSSFDAILQQRRMKLEESTPPSSPGSRKAPRFNPPPVESKLAASRFTPAPPPVETKPAQGSVGALVAHLGPKIGGSPQISPKPPKRSPMSPGPPIPPKQPSMPGSPRNLPPVPRKG